MRKVWLLLVAVLLLFATVGTANAEEAEIVPDEALIQEARQLYLDSLYASGRESFHGFCGMMTSYQLWKLGINETLISCDGNQQYDTYATMEKTSGGYAVRAYGAEEYSLAQALDAVTVGGTKNVRNILLGFQWTNTEAGASFGHACVINAIEDGIAYFTESFDYAMGRMEGQVVTCTLEELVDFFDDWTVFDGLIYFGDKTYADTCDSYNADIYVQTRFDSNLRSQPCLVGENDCQRLRSLTGGEILHATGVYESGDGDLYYQIAEGRTVGYVSANAVFVLQNGATPGMLTYEEIPAALEEGQKLSLMGTVTANSATLQTLELELLDRDGNQRLSVRTEVQSTQSYLSLLNQQLEVYELEVGSYTLQIYGLFASAVAENGAVNTVVVRQELCRRILTVGDTEPMSLTPETLTREGWFEENGIWYCCQNGKSRTGWITRVGVRYYLKADGSVTTGWAEIDDKRRYFSGTGALCYGWVSLETGTYYWFADGNMATGEQQIDGVTYFFDEKGRLITKPMSE